MPEYNLNYPSVADEEQMIQDRIGQQPTTKVCGLSCGSYYKSLEEAYYKAMEEWL